MNDCALPIVFWYGLKYHLVTTAMVEKDGDEGDEEGRTFRAAIDTLIHERNKQKTDTKP